MTKHFLYLTNDKLIALVCRRGAIVERDTFNPGDAEKPAFAEYLARHRSLPAHLITDLIEEDFRTDTVPHLRGGDQDAVLGRKLAQLYRASSFRHAIIQGREEEGRRDDRVLYHAVTNGELLTPWLAALARAEIPLEGIHSSAVLSVRLLQTLGLAFVHTLLVTIVPDFGLRQTYFRNRQIKFSRLTPIIYDEGQTVGKLIAAEASRTWQYLDSQRYFAGSDTLEVCIVVHAKDREMIADAIRAYPLFKYRFIDIGDVAEKIKLKPAPISSHAEELLTYLYAQGSVENHFAEKDLLRFAKYRRTRIGLYAATAGILAAGIAATSFNLYQAARISNEIDKRNQLTRSIQSEYQSISDSLRGQTTATDAVRDASTFFRNQIKPQPASPGNLLRELSGVWSEFPDLRLLQVVWAPHHDAAFSPAFQSTTNPSVTAIRSETKATAGTAVAAASAAVGAATSESDPPLPGNQFEVLLVEAGVLKFDGDYRAALATVERFIARVNTVAGLRASAVSLPLDVRPNAMLRANLTATEANDTRFVVRIVRSRGGT